MEAKTCIKCKKTKFISEFYKRGNSERLRSLCKDCEKERANNSPRSKEIQERSRRKHFNDKKINEMVFLMFYGFSKTVYYKNGREIAIEVFERDEGKCQNCGSTEKLSFHHINGKGQRVNSKSQPIKLIDNRPENMVVLCASCHMKHHSRLYWKTRNCVYK